MLLYTGLFFLKDGGGDEYPYSRVIRENSNEIIGFLIKDLKKQWTCILC